MLKVFVIAMLKNWKGLVGLVALLLVTVACPAGNMSTPSQPSQSNSQQAPMTIDIRISSDIEGGKCLQTGERFYLSLQMEGIPSDFIGPRSANVIFEVGGVENGKVWVLNETQAIKFQLGEDEVATGSIRLVFQLPDGTNVEYANPSFPYFRNIGDREGKHCFSLPFGPRPNSPLRRA